MASQRTAYELSQSQVTTPKEIVTLFWKLARKYRQRLDCVLDMGAGDCRFSVGGNFSRYIGVEIDKARVAEARGTEEWRNYSRVRFPTCGVGLWRLYWKSTIR